jgi:hypothetical protein
MDHRRRCTCYVVSRISLRSGKNSAAPVEVADGGKGRHARKVVFALGDDLVHPASLERSGVCAHRDEENGDNKRNGLDSRHVACSKLFVVKIGYR